MIIDIISSSVEIELPKAKSLFHDSLKNKGTIRVCENANKNKMQFNWHLK